MRILIIALVAVGFVSCADTNNPEHAFKTKSLRCNLEHIQYRRGYLKVLTNAYFNENPEKYGEVCAVAMTLDSLASEFNTYADCQLETALPVESQQIMVEEYNATLRKIDAIQNKNFIRLKNSDSIQVASKLLKLDEELVLYFKLNVEQAVSQSMEYLIRGMSFGGGFSWPQIALERIGANSIGFSDKVIQRVRYRQIKLTDIRKDGISQTLHPRISNDYTFGKITFDTLAPGIYTLKGVVHMLIGDSRFMEEPFEYKFEVE